MALIDCIECGNIVSNKAISCPHCGLPFQIASTKSFQSNELNQGVWVDIRTGLMWSRVSIGQQWANGECYGTGLRMTWDQAIKACQSFNLAGYNDWRLPTTEELKTILNPRQSGFNCPDNVLFKPNPESQYIGTYWSATKHSGFFNAILGLAHSFDFTGGIYGGTDTTAELYVRAIRRHI